MKRMFKSWLITSIIFGAAVVAAGKYESDAPLRAHMGAIRAAVQSKMGDYQNGAIKAGAYQELSVKIDKSVQLIFKECKLKPDADAALHTILSKIMSGSMSMKSGANPEVRAKGFLEVKKALESFDQTFNVSTEEHR